MAEKKDVQGHVKGHAKNQDKSAQSGPTAPKRPIGQTILVILLIAAVAIIFGLGPSSLNMALGGSEIYDVAEGVSNVDEARHQRVAVILLALQFGQKPHEMSDEEWGSFQQRTRYFVQSRRELSFAQLAERDGMKPSGKALDTILNDFVNEKFGNGESKLKAIQEVQKANVKGRSFTRNELREYLAVKRANANFDSRYSPDPVAVDSMGNIFYKKSKERIYTQEAVISTSVIINEFKELVAKDQDLLQATYDSHKRAKRFEIPRKAHLTLFGADATLIAAAVVISDEDIAAWYAKHKESDSNIRIVTPVKGEDVRETEGRDVEKVKEPIITYKTLADSKAYIRGILESQTANHILNELCEKLISAVQESDLLDNFSLIEGKEAELVQLAAGIHIPASDKRVKSQVTLTVWTEVTGDDPGADKDIQLFDKDAKPLARFNQSGALYLFNGGRGKISLPQSATGRASFKAMIVTNAIDAASDKEFDIVKEEVILLAAVEKAHPELIKRAQALQVELNKEPNRDLQAFFAASERSFWAAEVSEKDYGPLDIFELPDEDAEELPVMAYTQPGKQYVLVKAPQDGKMERVKLVKIIRHEIKDSAVAEGGKVNLRDQRKSYITAVNAMAENVFNKEMAKRKSLQ